ncbi:MAG TPA: hypothetical protein V6D48_16820 [Oculatellaceae cyanobacterium]
MGHRAWGMGNLLVRRDVTGWLLIASGTRQSPIAKQFINFLEIGGDTPHAQALYCE